VKRPIELYCIGIDKQFGGIEPESTFGIVCAFGAISVAAAGMGSLDEEVPEVVATFFHRQAAKLVFALISEQTEFDARGMAREDGECGAFRSDVDPGFSRGHVMSVCRLAFVVTANHSLNQIC
jgi:hypothetical protein